MHSKRSVHAFAAVVVGAVLVLAGCGGSSGSKSSTPTTVPGHVAKEAAADPSESAKMVCAPEAVGDIAETLGVKTTQPPKPTWVDHVYSCDYVYPNGTMTLSVKELSSADDTTAYFNGLADKLGKSQDIQIGQGAFTTKNGSAVVRKDYKVLLVDTTKLPAQFGVPADTRENVAINVAETIMGCWTGA
jgi:hypothetical protein